MPSNPVMFDEESQMLADLDPDPGADPDYWLDTYPLMSLALADQSEGMTAQDAADLLAGIVNDVAGEHLDDNTVLGCYLDAYVLVDA